MSFFITTTATRPAFASPWTARARSPSSVPQPRPNPHSKTSPQSPSRPRTSRSKRTIKRARSSPGTSRNNSSAAAQKWDRVQPHAVTQTFTKVSDLRPESCPALVLNADFSPLSYMPLSLWPWQEVVKAVFLDRVTVVATYDVGVRSPGMIFPLPSVISLKRYQPVTKKRPAFTRFNVFLRDNFSCQYCGKRFPTQELTFDHVVPRCLGGKTNWGNVVTACIGCNHRKGRYLLEDLKGMALRSAPTEPSNFVLQENAKKFPPRYLHESWRDYIYWSQSMNVEEQ
eukprot:GFKZ01014556.1.p1 GENE.GFKZ01014556.1~~GFKZ01014556.1.p1  ORF type:complete len:284 (-),score=17.97 GFKZ01014556.1:490-1341(-)